MTALKVLVGADDLIGFGADIGLEDLGADSRVILDRNDFADVVAERGDDDFFRRAVTHGPRCGLQAVLELVDVEPVNLLFQLQKHRFDDLRHARLALAHFLPDRHPLGNLSLIHSRKRHDSSS